MEQTAVLQQIIKAAEESAVDAGTFGADVATILKENGLITEEKFRELMGDTL